MAKKITCPHCNTSFPLPKLRRIRLSGGTSKAERAPKEYNCPNCHKKVKDDEAR